jgi:hypothetical protein
MPARGSDKRRLSRRSHPELARDTQADSARPSQGSTTGRRGPSSCQPRHTITSIFLSVKLIPHATIPDAPQTCPPDWLNTMRVAYHTPQSIALGVSRQLFVSRRVTRQQPSRHASNPVPVGNSRAGTSDYCLTPWWSITIRPDFHHMTIWSDCLLRCVHGASICPCSWTAVFARRFATRLRLGMPAGSTPTKKAPELSKHKTIELRGHG